MSPADLVLDPAVQAAGGPGALSHEDYYLIADAALPGGGLGSYSLPKDIRFIIHRGEGARLQDVRGRWFVDYVGGAGALILGHAHPAVVAAIIEQTPKGIHFFGTLNEACVRLAKELVEAIPCADKIAFASTGSEATFYAMRMARAFTGRSKILKCEGAYHGNHDYSAFSIMPKSLSNYPVGQPDSGGIPTGVPDSVLVAPYNDLDTIRRIVETNRDDLAAIIVEPVQRIIFPRDGFLAGLRKICDDNDVLLIFDEVVTGFRLSYGGAQEYFGVTPDLASYGKIIGGGGPVSCVGGRADIVNQSDPGNKGSPGYAYINGTLHGNPLGSVAGLATLAELRKPGFYDTLHGRADDLVSACQKVLDRHRLDAIALGRASLWQVVFTDKPPLSHADMMKADMARTRRLDIEQMQNGIYVLPAVRRFVSAVHGDGDIEFTLKALDEACRVLG